MHLVGPKPTPCRDASRADNFFSNITLEVDARGDASVPTKDTTWGVSAQMPDVTWDAIARFGGDASRADNFFSNITLKVESVCVCV